MKLTNGVGTCYRQAGNRRRSWVVKKTITGKQKTVGYFKDYEHGMSFLVDYNRDPALFSNDITFKELYARWRDPMHCSALHDMAFRKVFNRIMGGFNMHHALHECQHTRKTTRELRKGYRHDLMLTWS